MKIRLPQYPHFTRLDTLNPNWTNKGLEHLIYDRDISEFGRPERPQVLEIPDWLKTVYQPRKRTTKIYRLYLYYCYQLGILPKDTTYHPASPQLRANSGTWTILTGRPGIWPVTTSKPWRNCWQIEQQKNHSWKR